MLDLNKPIIKYAIVGASGVLVNTTFLYVFTEYVGLYYLLSAVLASEISIITNFIWNDMWTFSNENPKMGRLNRFISYQIISVFGTAMLITIMFILTEKFGMYYIYANLGGVGLVFIINYFLNKRITWK